MSRTGSQPPKVGDSGQIPDHRGFSFKSRAQTSTNLSIKTLDISCRKSSLQKVPVKGLLTASAPGSSSLKSFISNPIKASPSSDAWRDREDETEPQLNSDPPRPPREGYEWVWFPKGYWAERPNRRLQEKNRFRLQWNWRSPISGKEIDNPPSTREGAGVSQTPKSYFALPKSPVAIEPTSKYQDAQNSISTPQNSGRILRWIQYMSPTHPHFVSPTGEPEGLYGKAKRGMGKGLLRKRKKEPKRHHVGALGIEPSRTTTILEGVSGYFSRMQGENLTAQNLGYIPAEGRNFVRRSMEQDRRIGLAPWHKLNSQDTIWSATSSVREVLRGRTPLATPDSEQQYYGPDGKKYARVEISNAEDPTFLPSEAQRVSTPPLATGTHGPARGFFFDIGSLSDESESDVISSGRPAHSRVVSHKDAGASSTVGEKREWWDVDVSEVALTSGRWITPPKFELDAPEHLPTSPLCPMNPKHKSGGTGICVYHGRSQRTSNSGSMVVQMIL